MQSRVIDAPRSAPGSTLLRFHCVAAEREDFALLARQARECGFDPGSGLLRF